LGLSGEASVQNPGSLVSAGAQTINYTGFNKIYNISDTVGTDCYRLDFVYGPDQQRWKTTLKKNNIDTKTILFAGDYEKVTTNGITQELYYIGDKILYVKQAGQPDKIYCLIKDHLGSIVKIVDNTGATVFAANYDVWGNRTVTNNTFAFHRGFTGHEHLPEFNLINMNGRVYDPILGRFLSPDPFVQAPFDTQNFNRYSYALNNPLKYTDPDGEAFYFFIMPYVGFSPNGGMEYGLTGGIGVGGFNAFVSLGYGKEGGFTGTVGVSYMGGNVYAGYNSKAGFIAGVGYGFGFGGVGNFSFNSSAGSLGINYSSNGGFSANIGGLQYNRRTGWTGDPSIGISYTWGKGIYSVSESDDIGVTTKDNASKTSITTDEQLNSLLEKKNIDFSTYYASDVSIEKQIQTEIEGSDYLYKNYRRNNGVIYKLKNGQYDHAVGGVTASMLNGFKRPYSIIYLSTHKDNVSLMISLYHEFIHSWQFAKFGYANKREWEAFKEPSAYRYTQIYYPTISVPSYSGPWLGKLYTWPILPSLF